MKMKTFNRGQKVTNKITSETLTVLQPGVEESVCQGIDSATGKPVVHRYHNSNLIRLHQPRREHQTSFPFSEK